MGSSSGTQRVRHRLRRRNLRPPGSARRSTPALLGARTTRAPGRRRSPTAPPTARGCCADPSRAARRRARSVARRAGAGVDLGVAMLFARGDGARRLPTGRRDRRALAAGYRGCRMATGADRTLDARRPCVARRSLRRIVQAVRSGSTWRIGADRRRAAHRARRALERATRDGAPRRVRRARSASRTVTYKALVRGECLLGAFYPDLTDPRYRAWFALFHQRFSTNTTPVVGARAAVPCAAATTARSTRSSGNVGAHAGARGRLGLGDRDRGLLRPLARRARLGLRDARRGGRAPRCARPAGDGASRRCARGHADPTARVGATTPSIDERPRARSTDGTRRDGAVGRARPRSCSPTAGVVGAALDRNGLRPAPLRRSPTA